MLMQITATPAGKYVVQDWGIKNAIAHWDNQEALELLEAIIKDELPEMYDLKLLSELNERGLIKFDVMPISINEETFAVWQQRKAWYDEEHQSYQKQCLLEEANSSSVSNVDVYDDVEEVAYVEWQLELIEHQQSIRDEVQGTPEQQLQGERSYKIIPILLNYLEVQGKTFVQGKNYIVYWDQKNQTLDLIDTKSQESILSANRVNRNWIPSSLTYEKNGEITPRLQEEDVEFFEKIQEKLERAIRIIEKLRMAVKFD